MIFTRASSEQLILEGLHLNANYFNALFQARHNWAFFSRARLAGNNCISMLNEDVLDKVLLQTNSFNQINFRVCNPLFLLKQ